MFHRFPEVFETPSSWQRGNISTSLASVLDSDCHWLKTVSASLPRDTAGNWPTWGVVAGIDAAGQASLSNF